MNIFRKKFIPINTNEKRLKNKRHKIHNSLIKRTNSQIISQHNNNEEIYENLNIDNTFPTKSIKNTTTDEGIYLEQQNFDNESAQNEKYSYKINYASSSNNACSINKNNKINNDNFKKYRIFYNNPIKKPNFDSDENINVNINSQKYSKSSYSYLNKSSSEISENKNKNHFNHKIAEQSSNSNISNSIYNFNDENNKKGLIYNYNQMNKHINKTKKEKNKINNKEYKSQSHSKYYDLMKKEETKI